MNSSLNKGVNTKERFFSFSYLSFSSPLLMCNCTSLVRIFPCDCDAEGEGLEIGEGDLESTLNDRWELALELVRLRILPNMVSKDFKGVREKFRARLPLDFFSTLFICILSLEAAVQRLESEVF
jgi:hypothetical protein